MHATLAHANGSNSKRLYLFTLSNQKFKILKPSFYGISQSNLSVFLKWENSITGFMTDLAMFDCFLILLAREKSHMEKVKAGENVVQWKRFLMKSRWIVLNWWLSTTDSTFLKLMGPSDFIPVHKLCLHDKLSMYIYK